MWVIRREEDLLAEVVALAATAVSAPDGRQRGDLTTLARVQRHVQHWRGLLLDGCNLCCRETRFGVGGGHG